ncbi:MAG: hypothetical protein ACREGL_01005, partial [Alphaproteobacteria bacterium]
MPLESILALAEVNFLTRLVLPFVLAAAITACARRFARGHGTAERREGGAIAPAFLAAYLASDGLPSWPPAAADQLLP